MLRRLIEAGLLPADARRVLDEVAGHGGRVQTADEAEAQAMQDAGEENKLDDRVWWYANKAVPRAFKRLLDASDDQDDSAA